MTTRFRRLLPYRIKGEILLEQTYFLEPKGGVLADRIKVTGRELFDNTHSSADDRWIVGSFFGAWTTITIGEQEYTLSGDKQFTNFFGRFLERNQATRDNKNLNDLHRGLLHDDSSASLYLLSESSWINESGYGAAYTFFAMGRLDRDDLIWNEYTFFERGGSPGDILIFFEARAEPDDEYHAVYARSLEMYRQFFARSSEGDVWGARVSLRMMEDFQVLKDVQMPPARDLALIAIGGPELMTAGSLIAGLQQQDRLNASIREDADRQVASLRRELQLQTTVIVIILAVVACVWGFLSN